MFKIVCSISWKGDKFERMGELKKNINDNSEIKKMLRNHDTCTW